MTTLIAFYVIIPAILSSIFLFFLVYRFNKIRLVASRNSEKLNLSLVFRILLLNLLLSKTFCFVFTIVLDFLMVILTASVYNYLGHKGLSGEYIIIEMVAISV